MDKSSFEQHTVYTVSLRDERGVARPASMYVCRVRDSYLLVRLRSDTKLHKITLERVERIVDRSDVPAAKRCLVPSQLLDDAIWRDRTELNIHASSPHLGH